MGLKRTPESTPPQSNTKKEPNSKNVGEYIDYEEIDWINILENPILSLLCCAAIGIHRTVVF